MIRSSSVKTRGFFGKSLDNSARILYYYTIGDAAKFWYPNPLLGEMLSKRQYKKSLTIQPGSCIITP
jgi:hypothetical protein